MYNFSCSTTEFLCWQIRGRAYRDHQRFQRCRSNQTGRWKGKYFTLRWSACSKNKKYFFYPLTHWILAKDRKRNRNFREKWTGLKWFVFSFSIEFLHAVEVLKVLYYAPFMENNSPSFCFLPLSILHAEEVLKIIVLRSFYGKQLTIFLLFAAFNFTRRGSVKKYCITLLLWKTTLYLFAFCRSQFYTQRKCVKVLYYAPFMENNSPPFCFLPLSILHAEEVLNILCYAPFVEKLTLRLFAFCRFQHILYTQRECRSIVLRCIYGKLDSPSFRFLPFSTYFCILRKSVEVLYYAAYMEKLTLHRIDFSLQGYIQITYVEPYFLEYEQEDRCTYFEQNNDMRKWNKSENFCLWVELNEWHSNSSNKASSLYPLRTKSFTSCWKNL